jgi:hypothetical protein
MSLSAFSILFSLQKRDTVETIELYQTTSLNLVSLIKVCYQSASDGESCETASELSIRYQKDQ